MSCWGEGGRRKQSKLSIYKKRTRCVFIKEFRNSQLGWGSFLKIIINLVFPQHFVPILVTRINRVIIFLDYHNDDAARSGPPSSSRSDRWKLDLGEINKGGRQRFMVKFSNFFLSPPLERDTKLVKGMELFEVDKDLRCLVKRWARRGFARAGTDTRLNYLSREIRSGG